MRKLFYLVILLVCCCWHSCEKPDTDATIESIRIEGEELKNFESNILTYSIELPSGTKEYPQIEVITTSPDAKAEIKLPNEFPGKVNIIVTAGDGKTQKTYTLNFKVALSSDATLKTILIDDVPLDGLALIY